MCVCVCVCVPLGHFSLSVELCLCNLSISYPRLLITTLAAIEFFNWKVKISQGYQNRPVGMCIIVRIGIVLLLSKYAMYIVCSTVCIVEGMEMRGRGEREWLLAYFSLL